MDPTDSNNGSDYSSGFSTTAGFNQVCAESCAFDNTASSFSDTTYGTDSLFGD